MTSTATNALSITERLRITQAMRQMASQPVTPELKVRVAEFMHQDNVDATMKTVLTAMISEDSTIRKLVQYQLDALVEKLSNEAVLAMQAAEAEAQLKLQEAANPAPTSEPPAEVVPPTHSLPAPIEVLRPTRKLIPYVAEGLETINLQKVPVDGVTQPDEIYGIVRVDQPTIANLSGVNVAAVSGLVLGYSGQGSIVEDGFGWVFPFQEPVAFNPNDQDQQPVSIGIRLNYPGPMIQFDPHGSVKPQAAKFIAAHELLADKIEFFMNLQLVAYRNSIVVSYRGEPQVARRPQENEPIGLLSPSLFPKIQFATQGLVVTGILFDRLA